MGVARAHAVAGVVDGKIYALGGYNVQSRDCGEVFEPKTQTWDNLVPMTDRRRGHCVLGESVVMEEKIYAMYYSKGSVYYSPSEGKWGRTKDYVSKLEMTSHCCVTDKFLYGCDGYGNMFWRESDEFEWKEVKGLEALQNIFPMDYYVPVEILPNVVGELLPKPHPLKCYSELRSFGVNIVFLWFYYNDENVAVDLWCAEISFERRQEIGEIWGTIEWSEVVATLSRNSLFSKVEVLYSASVNV